MALTTHPHLALRLNKEYNHISNPPPGLHGLFQGELYFTFSPLLAPLLEAILKLLFHDTV